MTSDIKDYNIWRKNTPLLYTQLHTSSLLWPSLSIDWLPDTLHSLNNNDSISINHRLILSSFSNGYNKQESLLITETKLIDFNNKNIKNLQNFDYLQNSNEFIYSLPLPHLNNTNDLIIKSNNTTITNNNNIINLGDSKKLITNDTINNDIEINNSDIINSNSNSNSNANSIPSKVNNSIGLLQRIPHLGDINRIKYCPQNPDLIATSSDSGNIRIFDRTRKSNNFNDNDINLQNDNESADILLNFHNSESWSLDWNYHKKFTLATASNDGSIAIWNLNNQFKKPPKQKFSTLNSLNYNNSTCILSIPQLTIPAHDFGVNEIKWIPDHDSLLLSVGEDSCIKLWDTRNPTSNQQVLKFNTLNPLNTLDINPFQTFNFITGSSIGEIFNLDLRNNNTEIDNDKITTSNTLSSSHTDSITSTKFSPHLKNTFATSSNDGKVIIWRDNKPIFTHHGHLLAVNDVCWCPSEKGILASCSNDNSVHIWQPIL